MPEGSRNEKVARYWADSQPSVAAYIRSMTGDFHDSQDILQDVAAAVVRKFDDYGRQRSFVAWALGIARNEVLAYRRRTSIDRLIFDDTAFEQISDVLEEMSGEVLDTVRAPWLHGSYPASTLLWAHPTPRRPTGGGYGFPQECCSHLLACRVSQFPVLSFGTRRPLRPRRAGRLHLPVASSSVLAWSNLTD